MASPPFAFTVPASVADVFVMSVAAAVATLGGAAGVVKDKISPSVVPMVLTPIAQNQYVVAGVRPVSGWAIGTGVVPLPIDWLAVAVPKVVLQAPGSVEL